MMFQFSILFGRRRQQLSSDRIQHEQTTTTSSVNRRRATPNVYNYYIAVKQHRMSTIITSKNTAELSSDATARRASFVKDWDLHVPVSEKNSLTDTMPGFRVRALWVLWAGCGVVVLVRPT
eukprot:scaffold8893_cov84-Cylindrotheca_fusiformis.AAC.2